MENGQPTNAQLYALFHELKDISVRLDSLEIRCKQEGNAFSKDILNHLRHRVEALENQFRSLTLLRA